MDRKYSKEEYEYQYAEVTGDPNFIRVTWKNGMQQLVPRNTWHGPISPRRFQPVVPSGRRLHQFNLTRVFYNAALLGREEKKTPNLDSAIQNMNTRWNIFIRPPSRTFYDKFPPKVSNTCVWMFILI